ncbi:hypothetical protein PIROE2DRAFT_20172 [Piromyces sp. E2]|nr:hypothetical protein PIROE2DRAFT_20172 [Piromyces sp. E2]|eukprot:OUM66355.1 hypothetical protein PIROE2DRAFT_20172 [Piromyces sp. E2]
MYGMAFFMKPDIDISESQKYINEVKILISQNYKNINTQLLQAITLLFVYGNDNGWFYTKLGIKLITENMLYFIDREKNNYIIKEDIKYMKNISLILLSADVWNCFTYKSWTSSYEKYIYINRHSDFLMKLISDDVFNSDYEYFFLCVNIFIMEIFHMALRLKTGDFNVEDFDIINMDILRTQHFFLKKWGKMSLNLYNDIVDDFSYYLDTSENDEYYERNNQCNNSFFRNHQNMNNFNYYDNSKSEYEKYTINNVFGENSGCSNVTINNNEDDRLTLLKIIKSISRDDNFCSINHHFLSNKNGNDNNGFKSSFEIFKMIFQSQKDFWVQRKMENFLLITLGERIYLYLLEVIYVYKNYNKMKFFPIAKSIAIICKAADDCTICLKLLLEAAENNNSPVRFCYVKSWVFYLCSAVYLLRYLCTQEQKYNHSKEKSYFGYKVFAMFPQETLAPVYFYLGLLKDMSKYFVNVSFYINEIKLLIHQTKLAIKNKTYFINVQDILFSNFE